MLQSFSMSFCLLSILLVRCLVVRGFFGRRLTLRVLKNWFPGRFLFRLTASSHPGFPVNPSCAVPYCKGFFWQEVPPSQCLEELVTRQFLLLSYGKYLSRQSGPSRPMTYYPGLLPSCLQQASWFCCSASSCPNFVHPERPLDGAECFFHWQIFEDLPRWWAR